MHFKVGWSVKQRLIKILLQTPLSKKNENKETEIYYFTVTSRSNFGVYVLLNFGLFVFVGFYGISTFVGYLTPNPFLCK